MSTMHGAGETPRRSRGGYAFLGPIFALGVSSADVVKSMPVKTEAVAEKEESRALVSAIMQPNDLRTVSPLSKCSGGRALLKMR